MNQGQMFPDDAAEIAPAQETQNPKGMDTDDWDKPSRIVVQFYIPAVPVSQPRQRHRLVKTKDGRTFVQNYTSTAHAVNAFKATARMAATDVYQGPPLTGPLRVPVLFLLPRPANKMWKKRPMLRDWYEGPKDRDNLMKPLQDGLEGLLWVNDKQIVAGEPEVMICAGDEPPGVYVRVERLARRGEELGE